MTRMNIIETSGLFLACGLLTIFTTSPSTCLGQSSGTMCYDARTHKRVPCSRPAPRPVQPPPPSTTPSTPADNSAQIEADRRAAEEAQRRRDEAARAEAERQRLERERQEKFERDKQDAINSLKGNTSGEATLKGGSSSDLKLKDGSSSDLKLKDGTSDYNRVRTPSAMVAAVRGGDRMQNGRDLEEWFFKIVEGMDRLSVRDMWGEDARGRFVQYLIDIGLDEGSPDLERQRADTERLKSIWQDIKARDEWADMIRRPVVASGPILFKESWRQAGNTCTLYALATSMGKPIWDVEQAARSLLSSADWRTAEERKDPEQVLKKEGLSGLELAYLAESLGKVRSVPVADFADVIRQGQPIMVHLTPSTGNVKAGHQVVLSRTFRKDGKVWYEMIDSNQTGSWARRYLSHDELDVLIKENGMVATPDKPIIHRRPRK